MENSPKIFFRTNHNYAVNNKDNNYISNEVVEVINKVENIDVVDISKESIEIVKSNIKKARVENESTVLKIEN